MNEGKDEGMRRQDGRPRTTADSQVPNGSRLPQSGVWFDDELAKVFRVETQSLREWVYRNGIPHIPAFRGILVDVADIIEFAKVCLPRDGASDGKGATPPMKKRPRPRS